MPMRELPNESDEVIAGMDRKDTRHTSPAESPTACIRAAQWPVPSLHQEDTTGRVVDLRAYCRSLQRGTEPGIQSGPHLRLVPTLQERAGRIREIQGVSQEEASPGIAEQVALWLRAFLEMEEKDRWPSRPPRVGRRHFGFSGDH